MIHKHSIESKNFDGELEELEKMTKKLEFLRDVIFVCKSDKEAARVLSDNFGAVGLFLEEISEDQETIRDTLCLGMSVEEMKQFQKRYEEATQEAISD